MVGQFQRLPDLAAMLLRPSTNLEMQYPSYGPAVQLQDRPCHQLQSLALSCIVSIDGQQSIREASHSML
jgi:hypothetical protein